LPEDLLFLCSGAWAILSTSGGDEEKYGNQTTQGIRPSKFSNHEGH